MPVSIAGSLNLAALVVPDVYVNIVPPQLQQLNGVPTNIAGLVGVASWGPKNSPQIIGGDADGQALFGPIVNRANDLMTALDIAVQQGANNFRLVRVTDGTDVAASVIVQISTHTEITFTSKYTGSTANGDTVSIGPGSKAGTFKVTLARASMAGILPEVFDNLAGGLTGNAVWVAIANAINNGVSGLRGPSKLMTAAAGSGTEAPTTTTYTLVGGTDGATTINTAALIGADGLPGARTGMYALRGTGASIFGIPELSDSTSWTTQNSFAQSEGMYCITSGPSSDTITNAISTKSTAGLDSPSVKLMFGDWCYYPDTVNGVNRLVSPIAYIVGVLANLSPEQSSLNKQLYGIVGTQQSMQGYPYANADLQALKNAGIDVIANPCPGGSFFGARLGPNTSSNSGQRGDNYPRVTNFLAYTIAGGMGTVIGKPQTPELQAEAKATLDDFLQLLWDEGVIGNSQGTLPFNVKLDSTNNPITQVGRGYMQADIQVQYLSITEKFIVNLQGGQTVQVQTPISTIG